jgi:hypothetical protein
MEKGAGVLPGTIRLTYCPALVDFEVIEWRVNFGDNSIIIIPDNFLRLLTFNHVLIRRRCFK